jgi:nucleoside-diphosphate-sugar epimerase
VRSPGRAEPLARQGVELVTGGLESSAALPVFVKECHAIVHAAGAVRGSNLAQFRKTNTDGSHRLLEAVGAHARTSRFLMLSSLAAREPQLSWYARSKREGEDLVVASGLDWCVLRPPAVYGPGDQEMKAIFDWMARGIALVPGSPESRNSLVHVSDLVDAIIACLTREAAAGHIMSLCDGKLNGYDWTELAAAAAAVYQRPVRLFHPPDRLLDGIAALNLRLARLTGRAPMLTPLKLNELRFPDWVVDNREITALTGWSPRVSLPAGLSAMRDSAI